MALEVCPHCTNKQAWYVDEDDELFLKCTCGYLSCVYSPKKGYKQVQTKDRSLMPKKGSKLSKCLGVIVSIYPTNPSTRDIADVLGDKTRDISSRLLVLQHKGYVTLLDSRKGKFGGSIWGLTKKALIHFRLDRGD